MENIGMADDGKETRREITDLCRRAGVPAGGVLDYIKAALWQRFDGDEGAILAAIRERPEIVKSWLIADGIHERIVRLEAAERAARAAETKASIERSRALYNFAPAARKQNSADGRERIPPEHRTIPMSFRRAAKLMGKGCSQDAAEWLSASVADGSIPCEDVSRQSHVFDRRVFPAEVWPEIVPK